MQYEMSSQSNNYRVDELLDGADDLDIASNEAATIEAATLSEFLRSLALGLGAVVVTSAAVYLAVAIVIGLGLSGLN